MLLQLEATREQVTDVGNMGMLSPTTILFKCKMSNDGIGTPDMFEELFEARRQRRRALHHMPVAIAMAAAVMFSMLVGVTIGKNRVNDDPDARR